MITDLKLARNIIIKTAREGISKETKIVDDSIREKIQFLVQLFPVSTKFVI